MKVTYGFWLDTRRKLQNGKFPVKVRVTYQRVTKYFSVPTNKFDPWEFTEDEWKAICSQNPRADGIREIRNIKIQLESSFASIVNALPRFTFDDFELKLQNRKSQRTGTLVSELFQQRYENCKMQGRISTAQLARTIGKSLLEFFSNKEVDITTLTPKKLKEYENWMLSKGTSLATVGVYTRELRALFNQVIDDGLVDRSFYPFGQNKFQPPKGRKIKQALYKEDVIKILQYPADTSTKECFCRDIWIFSYLCNGMNLKDISCLRQSSIKGNMLYFKREKTKKSNRTEKIISVPLTAKAIEIIEKWGNVKGTYDALLFPILEKDDSPEAVRRKVSNLNGLITDTVQRIAIKVGLPQVHITANSARDAFATISAYQGRPLSDISESLGHSSISVTQHYLAGFADEDKMVWQNNLL
jgi:integrase/recombinase XerD